MSTTPAQNQPQQVGRSAQPIFNPNNHNTNGTLFDRRMASTGRGSSSWTGSPQPAVPDAATAWYHFRSVRFVLFDLPNDVSTLDIWNSLSGLVSIVYIMLDEDRQGRRSGRARIIVEPPPLRNPWPRWQCSITRKGRSPLTTTIKFERGTETDGVIQSPLRNPIPARAMLAASALRFGPMVKELTMMSMRLVRGVGTHDVQVKIDFVKRKLFIRFKTDFEDSTDDATQKRGPFVEYELVIKFSHIKKLHRVEHDSGSWSLIIPLPSPPVVNRKMEEGPKSHSDDKLTWSENDMWLRQSSVMREPWLMMGEPTQLNRGNQFVDVGRWTTYCLEMPQSTQDAWPSIANALRDYNIKTETVSSFAIEPPGTSTYWTISQTLTEAASSASALTLLDKVHLPFDVRYQLEVCLSHGVFDEHNINLAFLEKLTEGGSDRARLMLECVAEEDTHIFDPMSIFENRRAQTYYPTTWRIPSYCALVRKAVITPTTMYFSSPTVETTNRVLRKYKDLNDRFLRVQFTDELTEGRIFASANSKRDDEVYTRVYRTLKNGIIIGDRHYEFLAFGNSQIRENGAYFFCPTDFITCDRIREWMGDLKDIRCVAKYAARMGQCFSTTRQIQGISVPRIRKIPDIERNGFCFTDGVGKISPLLADLIANDLKLLETPSAFQFRMGGCKGVLVVWPDVKGNEVHIRQSQAKFNAVYNGLEIIRCSTFSTGTLNRQTITVLSALGTADMVFERLLSEQLANYDEALKDSAIAVDLLTRFVDENQMTITIAQMVSKDFMETHEPFVWSLLRLWRSWSIKALKEKARIIVEKSAFVLGCVDETATLRGYSDVIATRKGLDLSQLPQVFLQVLDKETGDWKVITGLCLVGRNPSLHPGDLRVVEAVDCPALRHLKNVVVFPQTGDRDVPSMCSGGDLDGDDYFVFWDGNLLPPQWDHAPMDYTAEKAKVLDREVSIGDVIQFFVLYMKNDSLPKIAHAHLAQADWLDDHARSTKCIELAALHSKAVDYVKSGNPASMPKRLQPRQWPHFMEKHSDKTYRSKQALGKLYDQVQRIEFHPAYEMPFDKRILNRFSLDADILKKARKIKSKYDIAMRRLMAQNEIRTEFEIFSTFVLSNPRVGTGYKLQETIGREAAALKDRFRTECLREAGAEGRYDTDKLYCFVAAMYQVTNEEVKIALHESRAAQISSNGISFVRKITPETMPLISFPWIYHRELGLIAVGKPAATPEAGAAPQEPTAADEDQDEKAMPKRESLKVDELTEMDYVRTNDGQIIHRGEVLNLFGEPDDEDEDYDQEAGYLVNNPGPHPEVSDAAKGSSLQDEGSQPKSTFPPSEVSVETAKPQKNEPQNAEGPAGVVSPKETMQEGHVMPMVSVFGAAATALTGSQEGLGADLSDIPPLQLPPPIDPVSGANSDDYLAEDEGEFEEEELVIEEETALDRARKLGF